MPNDPFIREKFTRERTAAKKLAAEFAFVFRDVRQPLKLVCQNCPTLRNGHERGGAADRNVNLLHEEPIFGCIGVALLGWWHDRFPIKHLCRRLQIEPLATKPIHANSPWPL